MRLAASSWIRNSPDNLKEVGKKMKDVNKVILIGRLGADPVSRETKSGIPVVHFPVATSRRFRSEGDPEEGPVSGEETQWHRVVAWGRQGLACAEYLRKGNSVYVEGGVRTRKFEGKDGAQRMAFEVHAENVSFLGRTGKIALTDIVQQPAPQAVAAAAH